MMLNIPLAFKCAPGSESCPDLIPTFPCGSDGKESACNAGELGLIPELIRSPGQGYGYPLLYSCLEKFMDRGAWWAIVYGMAKSWTQLSN